MTDEQRRVIIHKSKKEKRIEIKYNCKKVNVFFFLYKNKNSLMSVQTKTMNYRNKSVKKFLDLLKEKKKFSFFDCTDNFFILYLKFYTNFLG